jgi:hypothetical protein
LQSSPLFPTPSTLSIPTMPSFSPNLPVISHRFSPYRSATDSSSRLPPFNFIQQDDRQTIACHCNCQKNLLMRQQFNLIHLHFHHQFNIIPH